MRAGGNHVGKLPAAVEFLRHAHPLTPEQSSRLQHTKYLCKRTLLVRCVARRLDRITRVERVGFNGAHIHEVAFHVLRHVIESRLDVPLPGLCQLLFVVVDTDNPNAGLACDPPHRTAHSTANVDDPHSGLQFQPFDH